MLPCKNNRLLTLLLFNLTLLVLRLTVQCPSVKTTLPKCAPAVKMPSSAARQKQKLCENPLTALTAEMRGNSSADTSEEKIVYFVA